MQGYIFLVYNVVLKMPGSFKSDFDDKGTMKSSLVFDKFHGGDRAAHEMWQGP